MYLNLIGRKEVDNDEVINDTISVIVTIPGVVMRLIVDDVGCSNIVLVIRHLSRNKNMAENPEAVISVLLIPVKRNLQQRS